jgi:hypothetical protein
MYRNWLNFACDESLIGQARVELSYPEISCQLLPNGLVRGGGPGGGGGRGTP